MAVDKLVDSTQLNADLTSVANAIRTKGGTSAQLAFPSGFVSAVNAIPTGGSSVGVTFAVEDLVMPSAKFVLNNLLPNVLGSGGCIHYVFYLTTNTDTSNDKALLCFGVGALNAWSPASSSPAAFLNVEKNTSNTYLYLRPSGGGIGFNGLADNNGKVDVKLYADHYVNVNTGASVNYSASVQSWMTTLASKSYISVGVNQSNPLTGAVMQRFALERE